MPEICPSCTSSPRALCYWSRHIDRCKVCGYCYSPSTQGYCIACRDEYRAEWNHEFWLDWWKKYDGFDEWAAMRGLDSVDMAEDPPACTFAEEEGIVENVVLRDEEELDFLDRMETLDVNQLSESEECPKSFEDIGSRMVEGLKKVEEVYREQEWDEKERLD
ncbi:uncharacterized protein BDV17DRAFT_296131 [Aspergillus undulatus]|uniref:uncharacterized protein n=1 Tax=Aspergillus undulatus TaxID=1810928 RepID=UPI003CCE2834